MRDLSDFTNAQLRAELEARGWVAFIAHVDGSICHAIREPVADAKLRGRVLDATPAPREDHP